MREGRVQMGLAVVIVVSSQVGGDTISRAHTDRVACDRQLGWWLARTMLAARAPAKRPVKGKGRPRAKRARTVDRWLEEVA